MEEHSSGERVSSFTFVQAGVHSSTQVNALHPVPDEQCALDATEFA
jgi:hypothetical protein